MRFAPVALALFACGTHTKDGTKVGVTVFDWKSDTKSTDPRTADFTVAWKHPKGLGVIEWSAHVEFGDVEIGGVKRASPVGVKMKITKNEPDSKVSLSANKCMGPDEDGPAPAPLAVRCIMDVNTSMKDVELVGVLIHGDGQIDHDRATTAGDLYFRR
jgi:hypothetical protein